ncbi:unnamed protein product, partial [Pylaiella littoralis]
LSTTDSTTFEFFSICFTFPAHLRSTKVAWIGYRTKTMPPAESLSEESVPPPSAADGPPGSGWVRNTTLFRAKSARGLRDTDRNMVLRELSQELNPNIGSEEPMSMLQEAFSMFLFFLFPGCMVWLPFALAGATWGVHRYLPAGGTLQLLFALGMGVLLLFPLHHWPAAMETWLTPHLFRYTSACSAWEVPLDASRGPYMMVAPPHGVMPVGNIITMLSFPLLWGFHFKGLTTDAAMRLPLMRHVMTWIGCQSAEREKVAQSVSEGWSVGLCPGGVAEIFDTNNDDEVLFLKARKGFVKLSLRMGTTLVPCYTFGNTSLFRSWHDPFGILRALSRKLGFGLLVVWGRLLLPIILRQPLLVVTGRPIVVPKVGADTLMTSLSCHLLRYDITVTISIFFLGICVTMYTRRTVTRQSPRGTQPSRDPVSSGRGTAGCRLRWPRPTDPFLRCLSRRCWFRFPSALPCTALPC